MTLVSALDPALLIYRFNDWQQRRDHCLARFDSLNLHIGMIRKYHQKIGMSHEFASAVTVSFPWNEDYRSFAELRDLRQIILEDLQKAEFCEAGLNLGGKIEPRGVVCQQVECEVTILCWISMLCSFLLCRECQTQIATWDNALLRGHSGPVLVYCEAVPEPGQSKAAALPLVWNEQTWFAQLAKLDLWDIDHLERCIEIHFRANRSYGLTPGAKPSATPFQLSTTFKRELNDRCANDKGLQKAFLEALTKLVYGVSDRGLGDEAIRSGRGKRRFRITGQIRAHYHFADGSIILDRFGPQHRIDGVG